MMDIETYPVTSCQGSKMSSLNSQELMAGVDRAWLRMDHPTNLMVINSLMVLDGEVDREGCVIALPRKRSSFLRL